MRSVAIVASAFALIAHASPALALAPLGPAFQVNTYTTGDQGDGNQSSCGYWKRRSHGVGSGGGEFVVVWQSDYQGIFGQRFDATGSTLGGEFQVHTSTLASRTTPVVAQAPSGRFVVAWASGYYGLYPADIFARTFDAGGTPLGPEFQVSANGYDVGAYREYHYQAVYNPAIEADASGNFVVVWEREGASADGKDVMGRRLDASGTPLAGAFQVSELTVPPATDFYWNRSADVAVKGTGEFVVVWSTIPSDVGGYAVVGRRYDATGAPLGGEFQVNSQPTYSYNGMTYPVASYFESSPEARFGDDDFLVLWSSSSIDAEGQNGPYDVAGRFFTGGGAPKGAAFRVNTTTDGYQGCPSTDRLDNGDFVVVWQSYYDGVRSFGQVITPAGNKKGVEFGLTTDEANGPSADMPAVAALGDEFLVVWTENGASGWDIYAQRVGEGTGPAATCTPAPMTGCFDAGTPKKSTLTYSRRGGDPARARLRWRWKGEATAHEDFGNPKFGTGYAFCLYDTSGAPQPVMQAQIHASGACGNAACWRDLGSNLGIAVQYVKSEGNDNGITRVRLTPGSANRNTVSIQGKGANLALPAAPLDFPTITAQAQATNGKCWSAEFGFFIKKNEPNAFSALSN